MSKNKTCELCGGEVCDGEKCSCMNEKPVRVYFCPQCKSKQVKYVFNLQNLFGVIPRIRCEKCGYSAPQFPLLVVSAGALRKASKKKSKTGGKRR